MHSLPVFLRLAGRPVILLGTGEAAAAKRRLLERAGARVVGEAETAALAVVAIEEEGEAAAAVARLKARNILVNAVDRPALCDFTLPAIVDRDPLLIAIGTGGASAGLAKALRQRIELLLPASLGSLADALQVARAAIRARFPDAVVRRRAIDAAFDPGGALDPLAAQSPGAVPSWLAAETPQVRSEMLFIHLRSDDPDDLTLADSRALASADTVCHDAEVPPAILNRARADAARLGGRPTHELRPGLTVFISRGA